MKITTDAQRKSIAPANRAERFATTLLVAALLGLGGGLLTACKDNEAAAKTEAARFAHSAQTYEDQGQYRPAMLEAKNAIQKDPKNPEAFILLAKIYNKVGAFSSTQKMLESVVKKMPSVSIELAEAYLMNKKYRSAINILNEYPGSSSSAEDQSRKQFILARSNLRLGDKESYEKNLAALKAMPANGEDIAFLEIEYLVSQGKMEEAQAKLDGIDLSSIKNIDHLVLLGNFALQQNQLQKAEGYFTKALGILPNADVMTVEKGTVLSQLTEVLIQEGRTSEAYRYQKMMADANPESQAAQQKFNDAMEYYRQGKFDEAKKVLNELREQYPQDKNSAMLLGMVQYQQGQDKAAIEIFDKYIDPETATPTVIQAAALAKYRANQMDDAIKLLKQSVDSQPNNAEILATYGLALLDKDPASVEGEKALEKSLALNPRQQRLRLALAKRDLALKNKAQALAQLQTAYNQDPQDLVIQQTYFKALFSEGKTDEIKAEIANYQKQYPGSPRGFFLEGWFKFVQKDYAGAETAFEKSLSAKNNQEKNLSYTGLAELYIAQKQQQKALVALQSLLAEDPTQIPAYSQWMKLTQEMKRAKEGVQFLTDLEEKTDKWQPTVVLAQLLVTQGNMPEAIHQMEMALDRSGKSTQVKQIAADLYMAYAATLMKNNNSVEAKKFLMRALTFFPANMNYLGAVIEFEISQKNITEAQKLLDQFSSGADLAAEHAYLQGIIRTAEGNSDAAMQLFLESWSKKPIEVVAERIYTQYLQSNKKDQAMKFCDDWVAKIPNNPRPALIKAVAAQEKNDLDEAVKWYEKTVALAPQMAIPMNNLAWIYSQQKNPKAIELAKRAYELSGSTPAIMDTYGWILVENNRVEEGVDLLERAVNLDPNNKEIAEHLKAAKAKRK